MCSEDLGPEKCESAKCSVNMRTCAVPTPGPSLRPNVNAALVANYFASVEVVQIHNKWICTL